MIAGATLGLLLALAPPAATPAAPPATAAPPAAADAPQRSLDRSTWITPDDYPAEALALRIQGVVTFRLDVDRLGTVTSCSILQSSGYFVLDDTTCRLLMSRARFAPRGGEHGEAIAFQMRSLVTWRLPGADQGRDRAVRFAGTGAAARCIADYDGTDRPLPTGTCTQIAAAVRARGETIGQPVTVWLPDALPAATR